jgi:hypothetical protein
MTHPAKQRKHRTLKDNIALTGNAGDSQQAGRIQQHQVLPKRQAKAELSRLTFGGLASAADFSYVAKGATQKTRRQTVMISSVQAPR